MILKMNRMLQTSPSIMIHYKNHRLQLIVKRIDGIFTKRNQIKSICAGEHYPESYQQNEPDVKTDSLPHNDKQKRIVRLSGNRAPKTTKKKLSKEARIAKKQLIKRKNDSKKNRETGQDYLGYRRFGSTIKQDVNRSARQQLDTCSSKFCQRSAVRHCNSFSQTERTSIFQYFWKMNWSQKKFFVCNLIESNSSKKKTYYLTKSDNKKLQVCRNMFLNTFGIKAKMVRGWLNSRIEFGFFENPNDVQQRKVEKMQQSETFKENQRRKNYLRDFLVRFPKLESHYCRKDSEKEYFQTEHRTITSLYEDYSNFCGIDNEKVLSITTFSNMIKELNYSLFKPRKDQCDTCVAYKVGNISEAEFRSHRAEIEICRKQKEKDVEDGLLGLCILLCQDVQAVQLCPKLLASALYFKLKLQVHNFTIYDIISHKSSNYIWDETQGEVKASIFVSIVVNHIRELVKQISPNVPIIIYSDGCGYQNRNAILSSALSQLAMESTVTIIQKFLVKGHTQMECDSSHALIERKTKGMTVDIPNDFVEAVKAARSDPFPLDVHNLEHTFFYNYDDPEIMSYESIRPGKYVQQIYENLFVYLMHGFQENVRAIQL